MKNFRERYTMHLNDNTRPSVARVALSLLFLASFSATAQAIDIVYSGTGQAADQAILSLLESNFNDVNINYGDFSDYATNSATIEAADLFIVGRRLSSAAYAVPANSMSFDALNVPVVAFTSYVTRPLDGRWGWHDGDVAAGLPTVGDETTVTTAGAGAFGVAAGTYDWFPEPNTFNAAGTGSVGDGEILATIGGNILAAHWDAGDLSGTGATFGSDRFLFNWTEAGSVTTLPTAAGQQALINALLTYTPLVPIVANQWNVDGGGSFNVAGNWTDNAVPTQNPLFGNIVTAANAPATVTLDSPTSLNSVTFQNPNQYILAGPSALTLTGDREVEAGSGTHQITANVAGTAGLVKSGAGTLLLSGAKSYTGNTDVQGGTFTVDNLDAVDNQASSSINIASEAETVLLSAGATGTLAAELTGLGTLRLGANFEPADTVSISRSNATFDGIVDVDNGTLAVTNSNALGVGGFGFNRTQVAGNESSGKIALSGNITVGNEVLTLEARENAGFDELHVTSTGNNAWNGNILGEVGGSQYNIESASGMLTLGGTITAPDTGDREIVFSGNGNFSVAAISDGVRDADGDVTGPSVDDTISVVKRGNGTLTITTATNNFDDFWLGRTVVEQGSLAVTAGAGDAGELQSLDVSIREGATLNLSSFGEYSQQVAQIFRGGGTINSGAGTLALFDDASLAPGDGVGATGTLNVTGNVSLQSFAAAGAEGAWSFDVGNNTDTSGDQLAISGTFEVTGSPALTVNVSPAHGHLDAGSRTIVTHSSGAIAAVNGITAQITDAAGNLLETRQTVSVNGNTAGEVNVVVTGNEANRTWNGNVSSAWDVATTNNWQQGDQQFQDLDHVTFDDSAAGSTTVNVDGARFAGSTTFANATKDYLFTGQGGIVGSGAVNVTGTGQVTLENMGNNYSGATTVAASSNLRYSADATTGDITNAGNLSVGNVGANPNVLAIVNGDFDSDADNTAPPTGWTDLTPTSFWVGVAGETGNATADEAAVAGFVGNFLTTARQSAGAETQPSEGTLVQTIDLSAFATDIDNGNQQVLVNFDWASDDFRDTGVFSLRFFNSTNGTGTELGTPATETLDDAVGGNGFGFVNFAESARGAVPVGTRSVTLRIDTSRADGSETNLWFDNIVGAIGESFNSTADLQVVGDFTLTADSTLELVVESTDSFSEVLVDGQFTADGTFQFSELPGAVFSGGDVYDVFDFGSVTGAFDNIVLPTLAGSLNWDTSNLLVTGELLVVSARGLDGDYNEDGVVNAADYVVWRNNEGTANELPNDPLGGTIGQAQYDQWATNFGIGLGSGANANSTQVPEPTSLLLLLAGVCGATRWRTSR